MRKESLSAASPLNKPIYRSLFGLLLGLGLSALFFFSGLSSALERSLYDFRASLSAKISQNAETGIAPVTADTAAGAGRSAYATVQSDSAGAGRSAFTSPVELIYIDQYSLAWVEETLGFGWPWPRELYGILAEYCAEAKVSAFDILFTETSGFGPGDDLRCARAMDKAGNVVLAESLDPMRPTQRSALPVENVRFGSVAALLDKDGVVRQYQPGSIEAPSFGLAVLDTGEHREGLPDRTEVFLRFLGPSPSLPARNAAEVLFSAISLREGGEPQIKPEYFKDKYLIFGFSAPGLLDRQAVPTDPAMPGAEIHGTFVQNVLEGRLLNPLGWIWELLIVLSIGTAAAFCASYFKKPIVLVGTALLAFMTPLLVAFFFYEAGLVSQPGLELAAASFSFMGGIVLAYVVEGRTRAFLKRSFSQYLSPEVIAALSRNPGLLKLGGEERTISVFFSDIQGFTSLSESLSPERLAEFMNRYLSIVSQCILSEGGTLDKYVGDAVVAFWNAPLSQEDHAIRALRSALRCQEALNSAIAGFEAVGFSMPRTRIGIHTGKAIVGNMGSQWRFNYTALGDVVNTASRLEEANKYIGTRLLLSGDTVAQAKASKDFVFRRLGDVLMQGKSKPVEVWQARFFNAAQGFFERPESTTALGTDRSDSLEDWTVQPWEGVKDCRG